MLKEKIIKKTDTPPVRNSLKICKQTFTPVPKVIFSTTLPNTCQTEHEIIDQVIAYFDKCDKETILPQTAGLLIALGINRLQWQAITEVFPQITSRADHFIEKVWVEKLLESNATGAMFYLKNNFRDIYKDKSEQDITLRTPRPILEGVETIKYVETKQR